MGAVLEAASERDRRDLVSLSKEQLDELEALEKASAEGPWFGESYTDSGLTVIDDGRTHGLFPIPAEGHEAKLIVALRNAAPELIAAARELSDEQERHRGTLDLLNRSDGDFAKIMDERDSLRAVLKETLDLLDDVVHGPESAWNYWLCRRDSVRDKIKKVLSGEGR